jgi:AraC-like DNA-binding protein
MQYSSEKIHSSAELRALLAFALENRIPAGPILYNTGLEEQDLAKPGTLISISQMFTAIQNALSRSNDPHLGLKLGLKMQITTYGMYGYALVSSTTVRAACHFAEKYQALTMPMSTQRFRETKTHGIWSVDPDVDGSSDPRVYNFKVEHVLGTILSFARDIVDPSVKPAAIRLRYPKPRDASFYDSTFDCEIQYEQPVNELLVHLDVLDAIPRRAEEVTFSTVRQLCDEMIGRMHRSTGLTGQLRQIFVESAGCFPPINEACELLGVSARTLRRKLGEEGSSYQALLDETRLSIAKKYLRDTELTIDEIAHRLNYSDASNFRHAFRRWTNIAPTDYRNGALQPD